MAALPGFPAYRGKCRGFPVALMVKNLPVDVKDVGSNPRSERSPGGGHGNPLQYFLPQESHGQRSFVGSSP